MRLSALAPLLLLLGFPWVSLLLALLGVTLSHLPQPLPPALAVPGLITLTLPVPLSVLP